MQTDPIEDLIATLSAHIVSNNIQNTELETIFTKYLLIYINSCWEREIRRLLVLRASRVKDPELENFVRMTVNPLRNIKSGEISKNVLKFSEGYRDNFVKLIQGENQSRYDNIVVNRHKAAHGADVLMTFDEVVISYRKGKTVINALATALEITHQA